MDSLKKKSKHPKNDLDNRLVKIYRFALSSLQESGANTLFLALKFLSWTRDFKDKKHYKVPLILLPINLHRKSVKSDFNLELPSTQEELPKDNHDLNIKDIRYKVSQSIKHIRSWEVVKDIVLSTFSFAKYLMWKDLVDRTEQLKQNDIVRYLLDTPNELYISNFDFPDSQGLDINYDHRKKNFVYCLLIHLNYFLLFQQLRVKILYK